MFTTDSESNITSMFLFICSPKFSDTPKYADPEVEDRMLQAFKFNKDRMIKKFQDFTPNGTASYERALTEAFILLNKKDIRVFVYLLGQHSSAEPYVEELACYNRGYAVTIATLADVKENVLKRLQQGILLGVAGIDVPIQSFRDTLRGWEVRLLHPPLLHKSILKSYYQNVDLNEVEIPQDVKIDPVSDQEYIDRIYLDAKETQGILNVWKQKSSVALINENFDFVRTLCSISFNLFQPMNPLPILGQHSNWQENVKSDEMQSNPLDDYETKDRYGSSRSENVRNGYYDPYEYKSSPKALAIAGLELHNAVRIVDEETGSDLQMPLLPPLVDEATESKNPNFSNTNPIPDVTHEPELMEEPSDEIFGKMDQDPYEAQLRALAAIESCRQEQSALLQPHFEQDLESNFTDSNNTHEADAVSSRMPIPGSLLDCVQKSVQQRCRLGSGTSSFTGRYACEAVCELIRERMPQLVNKLEDCKQPLIACTERFTVFHVLPRPPEDTSSFAKNTDIASYTGEYCRECGTR
ncbi:uncharacterized protein DEA37_0007994 [Paragonimus westermani]|uniref:Uncharacterized protein n=1 Tax=Paragonimus westermani TaxID=34504 RepID=A0A5J4NSC9_9TREM|nr:uncharacterized protein DEA37_0007994 [Paragonimus westermani]